MLEASHLTKKFDSGEVALDSLSLTVAPGEIFCLVGAPGAGKTTAVRLFLGFLRPTSGAARVGGVDVDADPMGARQKSAYIPERFNLYPELTGLENLGYCVELAGRGNLPAAELRALLLQAGLPEEVVRRPASTYSSGMRQQVGFAVALAKRAEVLILDEPTACLDLTAADEFFGLVRQFAGRGGAVLMATRDPFRARQTATRLGILERGHLRTIMKTAEIADPNQERLYREYAQP